MSCLENARRHLANRTKYRDLNAFISLVKAESVLHQAEKCKSQDVASNDPHSLAGQLIALKDNICDADLPTTAGSRFLERFRSPFAATVVWHLSRAGAIIAGKTNMDEFGMGSHTTHSRFGPSYNLGPRGERMSVGGSSGGSAIAVASGQCWAAIGTDTGGSVRLPAAYTGIVGFKPSYGLLSRYGVIAYANSLDTVGTLTPCVGRASAIFNQLSHYDPNDPTSLPPSTRSKLGGRRKPRHRFRIGIPLEYNITTLDPVVRRAWMRALRMLQADGHTLHPVSLPATRHALSAYYILAPAEASSNLAKYDGVRYGTRAEGIDGSPESVLYAKTRGQGFGAEVQRRILLGAFTLSSDAIDNYFIKAQKVRRLVQQDFDKVFATPNPLLPAPARDSHTDQVDVLLCPTTPTLPPTLSSLEGQDPVQAYMNDVFTVPTSLAGLPAVSVPVDLEAEDENLELRAKHIAQTAGIQVIGQYGDDEVVLQLAESLERANNKQRKSKDPEDFQTDKTTLRMVMEP